MVIARFDGCIRGALRDLFTFDITGLGRKREVGGEMVNGLSKIPRLPYVGAVQLRKFGGIELGGREGSVS